MLKIPRRLSTTFSLIIAIIFFVCCVVVAFFTPTFVDMLIDAPYNMAVRETMSTFSYIFVYTIAYTIVFVFIFADALMVLLLLRVRKGMVFTPISVAFIRGISWSFIAVSILFALMGIYFHLAIIVGFLALFLGLAVRVVKNVIEEATVIKKENDLTV